MTDLWARNRRLAMVALLCLLATAFVMPAPVGAEPSALPAEDRNAIRDTIARQLDAFRADDGVAAFSYASPMIRQMFKTADAFMAMVRRDYLPVYRPREINFRDLVQLRGHPTQKVLLVGPDQTVVIALYQMQRQDDGRWRINGCILVPAGEEAT